MSWATLKLLQSYNGTKAKIHYVEGFSKIGGFAYYNVDKANKKFREYAKMQSLYLDKSVQSLNDDHVDVALKDTGEVVATYKDNVEDKLEQRYFDFSVKNDAEPKKKLRTGASASRAKSNLKDIVELNSSRYMYFATLTFANEPETFEKALECLQKYQRRIKNKYNDTVRLLSVFERGEENDRMHWHCIVMGNVGKHDWMEKTAWQYGHTHFVPVRARKNCPKTAVISNYLIKYISKSKGFEPGQTRFYYASHGLKKDIRKAKFCKKDITQATRIMQKIKTLKNNPKPKFFKQEIEKEIHVDIELFLKGVKVAEVEHELASIGIYFYDDVVTSKNKHTELKRQFQVEMYVHALQCKNMLHFKRSPIIFEDLFSKLFPDGDYLDFHLKLLSVCEDKTRIPDLTFFDTYEKLQFFFSHYDEFEGDRTKILYNDINYNANLFRPVKSTSLICA